MRVAGYAWSNTLRCTISPRSSSTCTICAREAGGGGEDGAQSAQVHCTRATSHRAHVRAQAPTTHLDLVAVLLDKRAHGVAKGVRRAGAVGRRQAIDARKRAGVGVDLLARSLGRHGDAATSSSVSGGCCSSFSGGSSGAGREEAHRRAKALGLHRREAELISDTVATRNEINMDHDQAAALRNSRSHGVQQQVQSNGTELRARVRAQHAARARRGAARRAARVGTWSAPPPASRVSDRPATGDEGRLGHCWHHHAGKGFNVVVVLFLFFIL